MNQIEFEITSQQTISQKFREINIHTFTEACEYIKNLRYGRNANKSDLASLFADNCGTCSTKHAILKKLADENGFEGIQLFTGIFKMNAKNTPPVGATLKKFDLEYMPEAHCYLKYKGQILDFTKRNSKPEDFEPDLLEEIEISPDQISDYKVAYHKAYLSKWLQNNQQIQQSLESLWKIREQCILDLANKE